MPWCAAGRVLGSSSNPVDMLQSLHTSLSNLHNLLLHTAAKLQALDDRVGLAKEAHLATRRQVRLVPICCTGDGPTALF